MAEIEGVITLDPNPFIKGLGKARRALKGFQSTAGKIGGDLAKSFGQVASVLGTTTKVVAGTAAAIGGLAAVIAGVSIKAAREQIRVENQLNAVLKSTGGIAGVTAEQVKRTASEIQRLTNFGDEAVIGAQNLLLTFKEISADVFPRTTRAVADVAQAMGIGLNQAALQVGKALNDPVMGLTALRRIGITFSKTQEDLIKGFVKTGEVAKAQNIILGELESQFGGVAESAADAFTQLRNVIGDVAEEIGRGLIPAFDEINRALIDFATETGAEFTALFQVLRDEFPEIGALFGDAADKIRGSGGLITFTLGIVADALRELSRIVKERIAVIAGVITGLELTFNVLKTGILTLVSIGAESAVAINKFLGLFSKRFAAAARVLEIESNKIRRQLNETIEETKNFDRRFIDLKATIEGFGSGLEDAGSAVDKFAEKVKEEVVIQEKLSEAVRKSADGTKGLSDALTNAEPAADQAAAGYKNAAEQLGKLNEEQKRAQKRLVSLDKAFESARNVLRALTAAELGTTAQTERLGEALERVVRDLAEGLPVTTGEFRELGLALAAGNELLDTTRERFVGLEKAAEAGREALRKLTAEGKGNTEEAEKLADAIERINDVLGNEIPPSAQMASDAIRRVGKALAASKVQVLSAAESFRQSQAAFLIPAAAAGDEAAAAPAPSARRRRAGQRPGGTSRRRLGGFGFGIQRGRAAGRGGGGPRGFLSFQQGGFTPGGPIQSEPGEFMIRRSAASALGPALLAALNRQRPINATFNFNGPQSPSIQGQVRQMLPALARAVRLGQGSPGTF